ncbi:type II toxin-antitoxin system RelE/ParE family toxin [Clostridium sp. KNHs216]|uniref:type II toxin-antitoxin system RelE/ParE family toxin n=1 Tax=Clostridium sp. KNHs216 TaxID=1550235 RepID=UPI0011544CB3|nr:type II toxin-antitoxin system RelE/ParE family toxin [Clostridium sp. KNHs216]
MAIIPLGKFHRIFINNRCLKEIEVVTNGYSYKKDFQEWLYDSLSELDDPQNDYISIFPKKFEHLSKDLYAITYRHGEKNVRIIFSRSDNGYACILLCCFDEKNTKAHYKRYIALANKRKTN